MIDGVNLHHIGIIVKKISEDVSIFENLFETSNTSIPFNDIFQKVKVSFLDVKPIKIEFIEPVSSDSPAFNFLNSGGGIHHVAFETHDLHKTKEKLCKKGVRPLQEKPTIGFEGRGIFFMYIPNCGINLIELVGATPKNKDYS
jgi:methylmalonyl-CoA/ethylmalonyl-CoA epimerase